MYNSDNNYLAFLSARCGINGLIGFTGYYSHYFDLSDNISYRVNINAMSRGSADFEHTLSYKMNEDLSLFFKMVYNFYLIYLEKYWNNRDLSYHPLSLYWLSV